MYKTKYQIASYLKDNGYFRNKTITEIMKYTRDCLLAEYKECQDYNRNIKGLEV